MDSKETYKVQRTANILLSDQHYFNYVFKKTEKIVCVVLYILQNQKDNSAVNEHVVFDITDASKRTLNTVLATLSYQPHEAHGMLTKTVAALVRLESNLRVGSAVGVLSNDTLEVLSGEIEGVIRTISRYLEGSSLETLLGPVGAQKRAQSIARGGSVSGVRSLDHRKEHTPGNLTQGQKQSDRQDQILEVIGTKKTVSIKDLSEDIKDCSEKTIQRELNTMIEKGLIKREGERRWSRYSLI